MIYHCIRRPGAAPYEGEATRIQWENQLIASVVSYMKKIASLVAPTQGVFIGVDGVVPMGKLRQQRLRRFKSLWTAAEEERLGIRPGGERWDTNAITPGTAFMDRLGVALEGLAKVDQEGVRWTVSTANEPGEGEHKAMAELRKVGGGSHVVYGLDADLIVLSLLQDREDMWLFREAIECGEVVYGAFQEEEYRYFAIGKLAEYLFKGRDTGYRMDYCMAMSLLGNDFVPHGLSFKLKDGGHDDLKNLLREVRQEVGSLVDSATGKWRIEGLRACFAWLARREEDWVQLSASAKLKQRFQRTRGNTPQEHTADEWNKTPLRACEEMALVGIGGKLRPDWRRVYYDRWLGVNTADEIDKVCEEYCRGLTWILDYYKGGAPAVDNTWHFAWYIPPLWGSLASWATRATSLPTAGPLEGYGPLKPQEQLALVLPIASYWLIRDRVLRRLPSIAPELWPKKFELFMAGRKQLWECEAQIPLLTPQRLRVLLTDASVAPNRNGTGSVTA